ncbi:MAG: flagellar hook-length control protein FliK [Pseudobutyrivibrio sp.]|nr:flagellar hook-length control protein FliK [Pseudobutyrivibrio sp.]
MNINTGLNPYNSNHVNSADYTKLSKGQSLTESATSSLKAGEVFEGTVNSIDNGKVTIGLANGQTMSARLDSGVTLTPGQSVFFEVKSNDGSLIQIRPVSINSLETNPTLLKALDMANLSANQRTISMVNSMMQNSMPINPENLQTMNRAIVSNPGVGPQTIVAMVKSGIEITPDNISMFTNYASDKAIITDNFQVISDMLPKLMTSPELSNTDIININKAITDIFINNSNISEELSVPVANQSETAATNDALNNQAATETTAQTNTNNIATNTNALNQTVDTVITNAANSPETTNINNAANPNDINTPVDTASNKDTSNIVAPENATQATSSNEFGVNTLNSFASDKIIKSFDELLNKMEGFPKDNANLFDETGALKPDASLKDLFKAVNDYFTNNQSLQKENLADIIKSPLYRGMLKNILAESFSLNPKDITKPGEISKLYSKVLEQTEALERLVSSYNNKAADAIKAQTSEVKQNINFMNSANEMYNFVQIPLKMYNQNTDSMLYVRQNKRNSYEAGEEITAFLHFDMEYLGPTDVFVSLKERNVNCKWNLANEASMNLIESNLDVLAERLEKKGFSIKSEVKCGEPKASFAEDFLGVSVNSKESGSNDGIMHRYSFDMRA